VSGAVDQQHAVVGAAAGIRAVRGFGLTAGGSGAGHQRQLADALRIVDADDGRRREVRRTQAKLPDDIAMAIDFNHPIVELIGNQNVTGSIKSFSLSRCGNATEQQNRRDAD
jgi:hypothetical protein